MFKNLVEEIKVEYVVMLAVSLIALVTILVVRIEVNQALNELNHAILDLAVTL